MSICVSCAKNPHLKKRIEEDGIHARCMQCHRDRDRVIRLDQLATIISEAMQQNFEFKPQRYLLSDGDGHDLTQPYGDTLETVVAEMLGQDVEFFEDLVEAIFETSDHNAKDGEPDYFEPGAVYAPYRWYWTTNTFVARWEHLIAELKHKRRFFSESVHDFFSHLFCDLDKIKAWDEPSRRSISVVETIFPFEPIFRARVIEQDDLERVINEPYKLIGPAPRNKARSGRMSPDGVVALYCAKDAATALAELRPPIGSIAAVITMVAKRPLRVLNFERLERASDEGWGAYLSKDYDMAYNTRVFLKKLHSLISLPVAPGHESDYLITQTMAEYLSHVYEPNFDGITFKSVQRSEGTNLVLFANKNSLEANVDTFPVEYIHDSLSFHKTERVEYSHLQMQTVFKADSGVSLMPKKPKAGMLVKDLKVFNDN